VSLNFARPDVIQEYHESFLAVGCDAVETNTFGGQPDRAGRSGPWGQRVFENNLSPRRRSRGAGATIRDRRPARATSSALIGPGTKVNHLGADDLGDDAGQLPRAGSRAARRGVDVLLDRAAAGHAGDQCCLAACQRRHGSGDVRVPIMVQASFDTHNGQQMLTGSDPSALVATFLPYDEVACPWG